MSELVGPTYSGTYEHDARQPTVSTVDNCSVDSSVSPGTGPGARSRADSGDACHDDQAFSHAFDPYDILLDRYEVIRSLGKGVSGSLISLHTRIHSFTFY